MSKPKQPNTSRRIAAFVILILQLVSSVCNTANSLSVDGVALVAFREALSYDPYSTLSDWNVSNDTPCLWTGVLCTMIGSEPRVTALELIGKKLSGPMSPALGALTSLQTLKLQGNKFSGNIPPELFNATSLETILIAGNQLTGPLSPQIHNLLNLKTLDLSSNLMQGILPPSILKCTQLQSLVLARNFFSGPLPKGLGTSLSSLEQLDLSSNLFSGAIPTDLGKLSSLQGTLNLSYNHFSGPVPLSLGSLPYTVSLDLSHNNLSGRIPQDGSLSEQGPGPFLYNPGLCGFPLAVACPLPRYESPLPSLPTEGGGIFTSSPAHPLATGDYNTTTFPKKSSMSVGMIAAIALGDMAGISMVAILFVYLYWKAKDCKKDGADANATSDSPTNDMSGTKMKKSRTKRCFFRSSSDESEAEVSSEKGKDHGELVSMDKDFHMDIEELLRASAHVIGKGGHGIVYKVVLANGRAVAVRRLDDGDGALQKPKEFDAEVQAITKLRHPNVVKLLAYYWADDEKLLIYEFVSNWSLATALQGSNLFQLQNSPMRAKHTLRSAELGIDAINAGISGNPIVLSWEERIKIARGVAKGLTYLHEGNGTKKYVHGNLKLTKILLDAEMRPHIAGVGLERLHAMAVNNNNRVDATGAPTNNSRILKTMRHQSKQLANNLSLSSHETFYQSRDNFYRPPEALPCLKPTQKWDVYSFGILLMELLSGARHTPPPPPNHPQLLTWTQSHPPYPAPPLSVLDPNIPWTHYHIPSVSAFLELVKACTSPSPDLRPRMKFVIESLDKVLLLLP